MMKKFYRNLSETVRLVTPLMTILSGNLIKALLWNFHKLKGGSHPLRTNKKRSLTLLISMKLCSKLQHLLCFICKLLVYDLQMFDILLTTLILLKVALSLKAKLVEELENFLHLRSSNFLKCNYICVTLKFM